MISNQILQTTVDGLKAISRVDLCVIDSDGKIAAKTFDDVQGCVADALTFMDSPAESQVVNGYQFFKVIDEQNLEFFLQREQAMMFICLVSLRHFRFRISWWLIRKDSIKIIL